MNLPPSDVFSRDYCAVAPSVSIFDVVLRFRDRDKPAEAGLVRSSRMNRVPRLEKPINVRSTSSKIA